MGTYRGLAFWAALVALTAAWGRTLPDAAHLHGPPLLGRWDVVVSARVVAVAAFAAAAAWYAPVVVRRVRWRSAVVVAAAVAVAWTVLLAFAGGPGRLTEPFGTRYEYLRAVPLVDSPAEWLDGGFLSRIDDLPTHVRSHPPGAVLALWSIDRLGWGGTGSAAALALVGVAAVTVAVAVSLREVAGEAAARRALPFLALAPAWVFSSNLDAFYAGVAASGVAAVVLSTGATRWRRDVLAATGGVTLGLGMFLSYGLPLAALPAVVVATRRGAGRQLVVAAAGGAAVVIAFATAGFWWFDGLDATRRAYEDGVSSHRPYGYFVVGNLGAFALAVGPVVAAGFTRLRGPAWLLVGGALAAVAVADVSGLSKGAVERIWLPFAVWMPIAAAAVSARARWWIAAHAAAGLVLQMTVRSPW